MNTILRQSFLACRAFAVGWPLAMLAAPPVWAVGGGSPDPSQTTLNQALLALRAETVALRHHVGKVLSAVAGNPVFEQITVTKTLRFMRATTSMLIARIDYALPSGTVPVPDQ